MTSSSPVMLTMVRTLVTRPVTSLGLALYVRVMVMMWPTMILEGRDSVICSIMGVYHDMGQWSSTCLFSIWASGLWHIGPKRAFSCFLGESDRILEWAC